MAGFSPAELDITVQENTLLVTGKAQKEDDNGGYLHRGIARRAFERRFSLADHMKVVGASLDNGMLSVDVVHEVPETAKPRTIKIGGWDRASAGDGAKGGLIGPSKGSVRKRPRNSGAFCFQSQAINISEGRPRRLRVRPDARCLAPPRWHVPDKSPTADDKRGLARWRRSECVSAWKIDPVEG